MKYLPVLSTLLTALLLNGCFSGGPGFSGEPDPAVLRKTVEEKRMTGLKQDPRLRLGIPDGTLGAQFRDLQNRCRNRHLDLQTISCPKERLTGLLRAGKLDVIYLPDVPEDRCKNMGFHVLPGGLLIRNHLLFQYLYGP